MRRTENSDRFVAKYGEHDLHKEFDPLNEHPNKFLLKYSPQMNREHALRALHHPNVVFAGHAATGTAHLKKSDLENYLKSDGGHHYVKTEIKKRFQLEATPDQNLTWLDQHIKDSYKYYPEDKE